METDPRILAVSLVCASLAIFYCDRSQASEPAPPSTSAHEDLLMGYGLLASTLGDEAHLGTLKILKTITFRGPTEQVSEAMDLLGKASELRAKELEELRKLAPDVSAEPKTRSPIGDAITAVAKETGMQEMLNGEGAFDLRFILLQAQATRMVSAIATAIAVYEPNLARRDWLTAVAAEYEAYREQIVDATLEHVENEVAGQVAR